MPTDYTVLPLTAHIKQRRGTTAAINGYAGVEGELLIDTTKKTVVLPSGTAGTNYPLAREDRIITATSGKGLVIKKGGTEASSADLSADFAVEVKPADLFEANGGLGVDATSGKLKSVFSLSYAAATGVFKVLGADGTTELGSVTLPSHLSVLKAVTLEVASVANPVNGNTSGTYIHFVFTLSTGADSDIFLNVTDLIDIYTVGDGLQVNALDSKKFEAKLGNGLEINSTSKAIQVKVKSGESILVSDSDGLHIDTSALTTATEQVVVSTDTDNVISAGTDGGALLKLAASGNALVADGDGALIVPLDMGVITAS